MIRVPLALLLFPAMGIACLAGAVAMAWKPVRLAISGTSLDGAVVGLLIERSDGSSIIGNPDVRISLRTADGRKFAHHSPAVGPEISGWIAGSDDAAPNTPADKPSHEQLVAFARAGVGSSVTDLVRSLMRETRRDDDLRIVEIEKVEQAPEFRTTARTIEQVVRSGEALVPAIDLPGSLVTVVSTARIGSIERSAPAIIEFSRSVDGHPEAEPVREFLAFREQWLTTFRPIISAHTSGSEHLFVSDLVRHWKPAPFFSFRDPVKVLLASRPPSGTMMVSRLAPAPEAGVPAIEWFSSFCDALFSRWAYPLILALPGLAFLIAGGLLLSLFRHPPRLQTTVGVNVKSEPQEPTHKTVL